MERIDPNDLLFFAQVADSGSFRGAAERLNLPKSTLSRRISQLEERLGERLLLRTTRRLTLTELGESVLAHARQLGEEVDAVRALAEQRQAEPSGRLRVSMPGDFATQLLANMLCEFVARHPGVWLELDLSPRRVDLLAEGFDLAVRTGVLEDDALLVARPLAVFEIGLYAAPGYLTRAGRPQHPDELSRHHLLCLLSRGGESSQWHLSTAGRTWTGQHGCRASANSPDILIALAIAESGIAAIPACYAAAPLARGQLQRVLPDWTLPRQTAWAVFPGRRLMPIKTRRFIDMLEAALRQAPGIRQKDPREATHP
ncbi:LysR family transcriptional regulator [Thiocapsa imhoffii]|uniref:LysR family transcriptional regulator n=1 Tax=Thiocapsa imhoffii TaxID=382777 RepID=A0A9X1B914_9GAMM|nr:LysR family transcriptional regulator [Thiocapsa imhoffii]MBK1645392.1 LysR family transcriptional regulator [Thiocapsa imhoffii]